MTVHLWDDVKGYASFPFPKYAYKRQVGGKFKSIYGEDLSKIYNFSDKDVNLFESDVPPEMRVLVDMYPDSDEPSQAHKIGVIDIEVSTEGGFPNIDTADKAITGISLYDAITQTCNVFILDKQNKIENQERDGGNWCPQTKDWIPKPEDKVKVIIRSFDDEDNLLIAFMDKWQECGFTIVTGWNIDYFDMPYLYMRLKNQLGAKVAKFLSPIGIAYLNGHTKRLIIAGISLLDYILLYKKSVQKMEPTYALGPIGKKIVNIDKIQYSGNLDDLYRTDIEKFIEYNINDVKIVVALDKKLKFIELAKTICHVGHVPYENFHMPSRYLDGAILMYLKRNGGAIALDKPARGAEEYEDRLEDGEEGFSGAFVKEPIPGIYNWIFDLDLTSMYPNIIISLNISPETKVGKVDNFDMDAHIKGTMTMYKIGQVPYTRTDFLRLIEDSKYSLSSNGVLYRTDRRGVIPTILQTWFEQRIEFRKKAAECRKSGDTVGYEFYNRRQQVWKILLNSYYGVLGLPIFRWYDIDNAAAVTTSGVSIIQTTDKVINQYYKTQMGEGLDIDRVIYVDTDSCFVDAVPIIKHKFPNVDLKDDTAMTNAIMEVATEVQAYVNQFYDIMAKRFFNLNIHTFDAKQELISKTALWLAKKRYAQWIIHKEGALLKEPELEVKGIDVVRSSFPLAFRAFMKGFLKNLLTNSPKESLDGDLLEFKEQVKTLDVLDIAKNTSVKYVSADGKHNYDPESRKPFQIISGTPAQVKACLHYNDLLTGWGLNKTYERIHHGQKIKWVYVKDNEYGIEVIAMKGDGNDAPKILDFINKYVDRTAMFEKELKSKFANAKKEGIYDVLKWEFPNPSMKTASNFFDF